MTNVAYVLDIFLHLDRYLIDFVAAYGTWTYLVVIGVIFCETGLVIMPFLPGDSLLFALGAIAAHPQAPLNIFILLASLVIASFVGNQVNYMIGKWHLNDNVYKYFSSLTTHNINWVNYVFFF